MNGQELSRSSWADCDSARHARDTGQAGVSTPGGNSLSTRLVVGRVRQLSDAEMRPGAIIRLRPDEKFVVDDSGQGCVVRRAARLPLRAHARLWLGRRLVNLGFRFGSTWAVRRGVDLMIAAFKAVA